MSMNSILNRVLEVYALFVVLLGLVSLIGYAFYLYGLCTRSMTHISKLFVTSLFLSDLALLVAHAYPSVAAAKLKRWPFGNTGCQWNAFSGLFLCMAGSGSTMAIALYYKCKGTMQGRLGYLAIVCVWLLAFVVAYVPVFVRENYGFESDLHISCSIDYKDIDAAMQIYIAVFILYAVIAPAGISFMCYHCLEANNQEVKLRDAVTSQIILSSLPYTVLGVYLIYTGGHVDDDIMAIINIVAILAFKLKTASNPYIYMLIIPNKPKYTRILNDRCLFECTPEKNQMLPIPEKTIGFRGIYGVF